MKKEIELKKDNIHEILSEVSNEIDTFLYFNVLSNLDFLLKENQNITIDKEGVKIINIQLDEIHEKHSNQPVKISGNPIEKEIFVTLKTKITLGTIFKVKYE